MVTIGRLVNAFFRWEFNSCETLVKGRRGLPDRLRQRLPGRGSLTSLHYYFPWAIKALVKWCAFALVTGRRPRLDLTTEQYFEIADDAGASYADKLAAYRVLADSYFDTERYQEFCASSLGHLDAIVLDWVAGPDFDQLLIDTVRVGVPGARARAVHRAPARPAGPVGPGREQSGRGSMSRDGVSRAAA